VLCFNIAPEGIPFSIVVRQADTYGRPKAFADNAGLEYFIRVEVGVATVKFFLCTKDQDWLLVEDVDAGDRLGEMRQH
jgi:hypothetical protein